MVAISLGSRQRKGLDMTRDVQTGVSMATTEVTTGDDGSVVITMRTMDWRDVPAMANTIISLAKAHISLHDTARIIDADDDEAAQEVAEESAYEEAMHDDDVGDNWHDMTPVAEYDPDEQGPPHGGNWYDMTPMADHDRNNLG